jgi:hypothetical protein
MEEDDACPKNPDNPVVAIGHADFFWSGILAISFYLISG